MIKMVTACTCELENPQKAVQDILDQIDIKNVLLKNSVALLCCHHKFLETGIMAAVCKTLPFDVLGCTSMYFATSGKAGEFMLTVTVLTSDNIEFATGISEPLPIVAEETEKHIHALYQETAASLGGTPNLVFAFPPMMFNLTIDVMMGALDSAAGKTPIFGTVALDIGTNIRDPRTIYQGESYRDRMAILLFKGPVNPRFFFLRFPEASALAQDAVITGANGPQIISINNEPAASFLKEIGLLREDGNGFSQAIPLVIEDSGGGNPEVVVVQNITPEGTLICGRQVPVGGILNIGAITADYVLESARALIRDIKEQKGGVGVFLISCFLRSVVLGEGAAAEIKLIQQKADNSPVPYLYLTSGGELCPRYRKSGGTANQALQYAIVACKLLAD